MNTQTPSLNPPTPGTPGIRLPAALDLAARLAAILSPLLALLNRYAPALGAVHLPLHARLRRAGERLARLRPRLAAGTFRPRTPRPSTKGGPPPFPLPRKRAWIVAKLGHHAAAYMSQLQFLIDNPQTQALLAAAPPEALKSLGRTLRPVARLLGVDLPPELRLPPNPPRPKPAKPEKPKPPPLLPLHPQRRPRDYPFLRFGPKPKPA